MCVCGLWHKAPTAHAIAKPQTKSNLLIPALFRASAWPWAIASAPSRVTTDAAPRSHELSASYLLDLAVTFATGLRVAPRVCCVLCGTTVAEHAHPHPVRREPLAVRVDPMTVRRGLTGHGR